MGLNPIKPWILDGWSTGEGSGIPCVAVKCVDIWRNTGGEGVLAYVMLKWGNGFVVGILAMLPELLRVIFVWILVGLIAVDALATLILSYGAGHKSHRWKQIDRLFDALTASFGRRIYDLIDRRIHRAYPHSQKVESEETAGASFAAGCED